jgi:hypothetical protein
MHREREREREREMHSLSRGPGKSYLKVELRSLLGREGLRSINYGTPACDPGVQ